jgi:hypothetical protein
MPSVLEESPVPWDNRTPDTQMTQARMSAIVRAAQVYCHENGAYPNSLRVLIDFSKDRFQGALCRLDKTVVVDAWGNELAWQSGRLSSLTSAGPDQEFGTSDDLRLPKKGDPHAQLPDALSNCK